MKKRFVFYLVLFMLIVSLIVPAVSQTTSTRVEVDYVFCNGKIITIDELNPSYEAIAIDDGLIVALGTTDEIMANYEMKDRSGMDLEGNKAIMPGIIDGHTHYMASLWWIGDTSNIYDSQEIALANGYTTLNEKSVDSGELEWMEEAEANNLLRLRVNAFLIYNYAWLDNNTPVLVTHWSPTLAPITDHDKMLRIPGMKIYADGAFGARGFPAMSTPYTPEMIADWGVINPMGDLYFNQSTLNPIVDSLHDRGFSVAFHSMGDRSTETVLNAIEYALNGSDNDIARHQIEHNSFIRDDLVTKASSLNTIHSVRGYFPTYWQEDYVNMYDAEWEEWNVKRYSMPSLGIHTYLETDFSMARYDEDDWSSSMNIKPFLNLWGLVTKKAIDENGTVHEPIPWLSQHLLTVEEGLKMMTLEGAYAVGQEDYIGSFEVGKYADLIVLNKDPLTIHEDELRTISVMLTMVGGKTEYQWPTHVYP
ncbi:MAG: amidohydrolase family protein, partial [Candidatus Heimdallarchaeota archaeon]|nr:amidohydrolase family protein [Candidatus Heimdallarchaeota archaeon]